MRWFTRLPLGGRIALAAVGGIAALGLGTAFGLAVFKPAVPKRANVSHTFASPDAGAVPSGVSSLGAGVSTAGVASGLSTQVAGAPAAAPASAVNEGTLATATTANPTKRPDATPVAGTTWPAKMVTFAKAFGKPVWYPSYVPSGYVLDSIDVVEFDPGSGLVCSVVFTNEKTAVQFTQGSPTNRTYPIVSLGKVAWGSAQADIMHQDPANTQSPYMIVYSSGGNFAEVSGDAPTAELKAVAASMKLVTY